MKNFDKCSSAELARYALSYFSTRDGHFDSIDVLEQRRLMPDATRQERFGISAQILREQAELAKLVNKRRAFQAGRQQIDPPTQAQVTAMQKLATAVDKLTANAQALRDAIRLTTDLANKFNEIQPDQG